MMNLAEYRRSDARLADFLPWAALVGEGVVLNKDGSLPAHRKVPRTRSRQRVPAELVAVAGRLNNALRRLGSGWAIFVEAQRHAAPATIRTSTFPGCGVGPGRRRAQGRFRGGGRALSSSATSSPSSICRRPRTPRARKSCLYEGRDRQSGVTPSASAARLRRSHRSRARSSLEGFMPECRWLDDAGDADLSAFDASRRSAIAFACPRCRCISMRCWPTSR